MIQQKLQNCPCCSDLPYDECCEPYVTEKKIPPTPLALMRSRFTAYTQANMDYITKTMREDALDDFNPQEAKLWAQTNQWQELKILEAENPKPKDKIAYVTFVAKYIADNATQKIVEKSEFKKFDGRWYYTCELDPYYQENAEPVVNPHKIGRNDPCHCGSGKKFKKCCAN